MLESKKSPKSTANSQAEKKKNGFPICFHLEPLELAFDEIFKLKIVFLLLFLLILDVFGRDGKSHRACGFKFMRFFVGFVQKYFWNGKGCLLALSVF